MFFGRFNPCCKVNDEATINADGEQTIAEKKRGIAAFPDEVWGKILENLIPKEMSEWRTCDGSDPKWIRDLNACHDTSHRFRKIANLAILRSVQCHESPYNQKIFWVPSPERVYHVFENSVMRLTPALGRENIQTKSFSKEFQDVWNSYQIKQTSNRIFRELSFGKKDLLQKANALLICYKTPLDLLLKEDVSHVQHLEFLGLGYSSDYTREPSFKEKLSKFIEKATGLKSLSFRNGQFANIGGIPKLTQLAIEAGVDPNGVNDHEKTPLIVALEDGDIDVAEILVAATVELESFDGRLPLFIAAEKGYGEIVGNLIAAGAKVNARAVRGMTALHGAAKNGQLDVVEKLIVSGAEIQVECLALHDLGDSRLTPLHLASEGYKNVVERLVIAGAAVNAKTEWGWTPLHLAVCGGHESVVESLIIRQAEVNAACNLGKTPLHFAAGGGHSGIVEKLIAAGAQVDARDNNGQTALHHATKNGYEKIVDMLIVAKAEEDSEGRTPLHFAAGRGYLGIVEKLIAAGAQVDARDENGQTALHHAASHRHRNVVDVLIKAGAKIDSKDNEGWTPAELAALVPSQAHYYP